MKRKSKLLFGKRSRKTYQGVPLGDLPGKRIVAVGETTVWGAYGEEPCIVLFFEDGTKHGFVLPVDEY